MNDRFLEDHCLAAHTYRLCGPLTPGSIRDMTMRAEELAQRLVARGIITNSSRVLIVGAGVAGTTCAASLLTRSHCQVTLNDVAGSPLSLQTGVLHRQVVPHGFDWPYYFYRQHRHPLLGNSVMPWSGGRADEVAKQFNARMAFMVGQSRPSRFYNAMSNRVLDWGYDPRTGWDVQFTAPPFPARQGVQKYDVLILCAGMTAERDSLLGYRGFRFWDRHDPFLRGSGHILSSNDDVLICGGGDGGLQDFIRLTTGECLPEKLVPQLENAIGQRAKDRYQAVQALAHRHYLLSADSGVDRNINTYSFESHQRLARHLYHIPAVQAAVRSLLLPKRPGVQLLMREYAFGRCYTPNAMLVSLLARALSQYGNRHLRPFAFASELRDVQPLHALPPGPSADDWARVSVRVEVGPAAAVHARPSPEVAFLQHAGVALAGHPYRHEFRAIFLRIGGMLGNPPVVDEILRAIEVGGGSAPELNDIRHAVPQSPLARV